MDNINAFAESLKRLYKDNKVTEAKIISLFNDGKLTEKEKNHILGNQNHFNNGSFYI